MAKTSKFIFTFQDIFHYLTRFVKYWKIALLLFMLGLMVALVYFTYGQPTYYSRSLVAFTNINLPIQSETSDTAGGRGRYAQLSFVVASALNSRWLVERTAKRLGIVEHPGQYEYIRDQYLSDVKVSLLPGNIFQIDVHAYKPWIVHAWPEAMLEAYREFTLESRAKHREAAFASYTEEMKRLRERIGQEQDAKSKFEEDNKLIEQYINNNSLESVPSEMLTIKTRLEQMEQVDELAKNSNLPTIEQLSLLKKFRDTPVQVGTIVRRTGPDALIRRTQIGGSGSVAALTSNAPEAHPTQGQGGSPGAQAPVIVVPSMVEELEPWEVTERELRSTLQEKEQAARTYLPGHEKMRTLDKKIAQLTASIDNELVTALNSFRIEQQQLRDRLSDLEKRMPDYRRVLNDFDRYRQDFSLMAGSNVLWEQAYAKLQDRLATMEFTGIDMKVDFEFQGFTLMRDDEPVSPNKMKLLTYALLLGLGCAGGGCFGLEKLRSTTSLVTETEKLTGLHAIGMVPLCRSTATMDPYEPPPANVSEAEANIGETFRIIRCSLPLHVPRDNRCQVIMVTSSRASEGKTMVSSLLARSFAQADQKTLLIDGDLRRGRVHRLMEIEQNQGLSGFLCEDVPVLQDVVVPSEINGLDILPRGRNSAPRYEALGADRLSSTIMELRKVYDRIIIDTPPLLGLADSIMVSGCVDGAVFVVRADKTTQRDLLTALEVLQGTQTPVYGFVLNGVDLSNLENYYYYSSYYPKYYDPSYVDAGENARAEPPKSLRS